MTYQSEREPYCDHTLPGHPHQPASACSTCKDGPELAAWHAYWDAKFYEFVSVAPRDGDVFLKGMFDERSDSGMEWAEGVDSQWVDGYLVHRR